MMAGDKVRHTRARHTVKRLYTPPYYSPAFIPPLHLIEARQVCTISRDVVQIRRQCLQRARGVEDRRFTHRIRRFEQDRFFVGWRRCELRTSSCPNRPLVPRKLSANRRWPRSRCCPLGAQSLCHLSARISTIHTFTL